jgi:transcriptional regulator
MYLKSQFEETRIDVLRDLIETHPLGTFIVSVDSEVLVEHMPFLISRDGGKFGTLTGHFPRANRVWEALDGRRQAIIVFHGANSYVTPSWYPSKKEHGRVVPTWNFVVVHARGRPRVIDDRRWLLEHLNALTDAHESNRPGRWALSDAPEAYVGRMVESLVGMAMPVETLIGKWKLSQNRPDADRAGVAAGLASLGGESAAEMARLVREYLLKRRRATR